LVGRTFSLTGAAPRAASAAGEVDTTDAGNGRGAGGLWLEAGGAPALRRSGRVDAGRGPPPAAVACIYSRLGAVSVSPRGEPIRLRGGSSDGSK
jgi:hypothetical protein